MAGPATPEPEHREAVINMLWISGPLPWYARLSIATFMAQGHPVHLFAYADVSGAPAGCVLCDASEVLPREAVFGYREGPHAGYLSGFANWFRCELLLRIGGWWADTDMLCRRAFRTDGDFLIASQWRENGAEINNNVLFVRDAGSKIMHRAAAFCRERRDDVAHTENGPRLFASLVAELGLSGGVAPPAWFNPVHFGDVGLFADTPARVGLVALGRLIRGLRPIYLANGFGLHLYAAALKTRGMLPDDKSIPRNSYLARVAAHCGVALPEMMGEPAHAAAGAF